MKYHLLRVLPLLLALALVLWAFAPVRAEGESITVASSSVTSEFPEGMRFKLQATSTNEITQVAVRFRIGQQTAGAYEYMQFEKGTSIDSELFWRTNTGARYIPPGTIITYNFELEDSQGNKLATERKEFIYYDARFQWEEVSKGPVSVAYHGPVKTRAEIILDAILQTLDNMGPLLGADTETPIRVTMYNNVKEMLEALPPGSATIRRELITEGQAFTDIGTLLVLGSGSLAKGTASHELTHILTHRAGDSVFRSVPGWLDEGLAEYGNIDPGFSYDVALEFAIATNRLLPITSMTVLPGNPEDVIIFYGQARSIVRFMVNTYGPDKMRELMALLKSGKGIDDALQEVYRVDRLGLENKWRASIGAPEYRPQDRGRVLPTPIARPTILPYSLTPQPLSETVGDTGATPTPEPQQSQPSSSIAPTDTPTAAPRPVETPQSGSGSAGCGRPNGMVMDISVVAVMVGLAWLGMSRRSGL